MYTNELPKLKSNNKTYYVDIRLKEFRCTDKLEFISFDSDQGKEILSSSFLYQKPSLEENDIKEILMYFIDEHDGKISCYDNVKIADAIITKLRLNNE